MTTTTALGHVIGNNAPDCRTSVWILIRVLALQPVKWVSVMLLVEVAENKLWSITVFNWMLAPHRLITNLKSVGTPEAFFLHVEEICLTSAITTRLSEQISSRTANISHHPLGKKKTEIKSAFLLG